MKRILLASLVLCLPACVFSQTNAATVAAASVVPSVALDSVVLPPFIAGGVSCSQFGGCAGFVSGIFPETSKTGGLYGAVTADLQFVKVTLNGQQGYGLSPTFKFGEHKVVFNNITSTKDASGAVTKMTGNMLLIGIDAGAAFSSSTTATTNTFGQVSTSNTGGVSINLAGSFTVTYLRQLSPHFALAFPVQLDYVAGIGPGGSGVWAPTAKVALVWTLKP